MEGARVSERCETERECGLISILGYTSVRSSSSCSLNKTRVRKVKERVMEIETFAFDY